MTALHPAFRFGQPETRNSEQGSRFTSAGFLALPDGDFLGEIMLITSSARAAMGRANAMLSGPDRLPARR